MNVFTGRRRLLTSLLVASTVGLAACTTKEEPPSFKSTDITGASFAREMTLTDHTGKKVSLSDYKGKLVAVFFGFTHCPDVCPTTLLQFKAVREALGSQADDLQVLFVTVDPERDTQEVLAKYVPAFDPSFVGLYGTPDEIKAVTREFKVYYAKVPGRTEGNYSVDHMAATYIFDREGNVRLMVRNGEPVDDIVADIEQLL